MCPKLSTIWQLNSNKLFFPAELDHSAVQQYIQRRFSIQEQLSTLHVLTWQHSASSQCTFVMSGSLASCHRTKLVWRRRRTRSAKLQETFGLIQIYLYIYIFFEMLNINTILKQFNRRTESSINSYGQIQWIIIMCLNQFGLNKRTVILR